jgi:hypothetical protein
MRGIERVRAAAQRATAGTDQHGASGAVVRTAWHAYPLETARHSDRGASDRPGRDAALFPHARGDRQCHP